MKETREPCAPPRGAADFCLSCVLTTTLVVAAVAGSFAYLGIDFAALFSAGAAADMGRFAASFFRPISTPGSCARPPTAPSRPSP